MNISEFFNRYGKYYGSKPAVVFRDKKLSFAEVTERVNRLANGLLNLGVKPDDKVALLSDNSPEFIEIFFARYELGVVELTLNTRLTPNEWAQQINECQVTTIFVGKDQIEKLNLVKSELIGVRHFIAISGTPPDMIDYETLISSSSSDQPSIDIEVGEGKLGRIVYTGGTTGVPKGVMLSRNADMAQMRNMLVDPVSDLTPEDTFLGLQPMYHAVRPFFFPCWMRGVRHVIVPDFHPETAFHAIENEKVTVIKTVPTVLVRLISDPGVRKRDLRCLRTIIYGGSPMPVERLKEAISIFGPVLVQNYGQSESAMTVCFLSKKDHVVQGDPKRVARLASVGRPYSWVEIRLVGDDGKEVVPGGYGELVVRGDHNMMGYLNKPEETNKTLRNGWVHTRDIGRMDEDGYVFLVDRKGDMIISGGENVYPGEVEQVLYQHPAVMEACVFGIPDEKWGESVTAAIAVKPGLEVTESELIAFCKERLAKYKSPQKIAFYNSLPKSAMGKILRKELRAPFWKEQERGIH
jgi:acyl-CoA synthetase (AMP-forming)/AMP-acid ligase II